MAARGAEGPGRRRAHLRGHHRQGRGRLGAVPRHALAGLRRPRRRDGGDERRDAGHPRAARHLPGDARWSRSSSPPPGGRTEHVENTSLGSTPLPWLRSVADPFDSVSPRHRWGPIRMTYAAAGRKLQGLVRGRFRGIEVITRGRSPRVVAAEVLGSRGRTPVSGATLRARFGLYDTWAYFTSIAARPAPAPGSDPATGGTDPTARAARRPRRSPRWRAPSTPPARAPRSSCSSAGAGRWTVVGVGAHRARRALPGSASRRRACTASPTAATPGRRSASRRDSVQRAMARFGGLETGGTWCVAAVGRGPGRPRRARALPDHDARRDDRALRGLLQASTARSTASASARSARWTSTPRRRRGATSRPRRSRAGRTSRWPARWPTASASAWCSTPTSTPPRSASTAGARARARTRSST